MSERFYTTLHVSGPNADSAKQAAIDAIRAEPEDKYGFNQYGGGWVDDEPVFGPCYFDKYSSGEGAVQIVGKVSRQFPAETFYLYVNGSYGEGEQGHVEIQNGHIMDGRSEAISYGDAIGPSEVREYEVTA